MTGSLFEAMGREDSGYFGLRGVRAGPGEVLREEPKSGPEGRDLDHLFRGLDRLRKRAGFWLNARKAYRSG